MITETWTWDEEMGEPIKLLETIFSQNSGGYIKFFFLKKSTAVLEDQQK